FAAAEYALDGQQGSTAFFLSRRRRRQNRRQPEPQHPHHAAHRETLTQFTKSSDHEPWLSQHIPVRLDAQSWRERRRHAPLAPPGRTRGRADRDVAIEIGRRE